MAPHLPRTDPPASAVAVLLGHTILVRADDAAAAIRLDPSLRVAREAEVAGMKLALGLILALDPATPGAQAFLDECRSAREAFFGTRT